MASRTLSSLPISVGTGLAIEALVQTPMAKYSSFLVNIRTIVRNAYGAFEKESNPSVQDVFDAANEDMKGIAEALAAMKFTTQLNMIYYYPSYIGLASLFRLANLKKPKTELEIKTEKMITEVSQKLYEKYDKVITRNNVLIPEFQGNGIIITHHPVDLATSKSYTRLHLLESHTGALKSFNEFYTKLTDGKSLTNIPLNKVTIQIFGDKAVNFYAVKSFSVKNEIKRLADEANWSSSSTPSFVYSTIQNLNNSPDKETLLKMI